MIRVKLSTRESSSPMMVILSVAILLVVLSLWSDSFKLSSQVVAHNDNTKNETYSNDQLLKNVSIHNGYYWCSCTSFPGQDYERHCCTHVIHRQHKQGYILTDILFVPYGVDTLEYGSSDEQDEMQMDKEHDYRNVIVTRNWFATLVSGYLYHKSGRECYKDPFGTPAPNWDDSNLNDGWKYLLKHTNKTELPPADSNAGQSLCHYLAASSVEEGMKVYIDVAVSHFYADIPQNFKPALQDPRTMFVCFESLVDAQEQNSTMQQMLEFLYPTGIPPPTEEKPWGLSLSESKEGHSSPSEGNMTKAELMEVAKRIDRDAYESYFAKLQTLTACGEMHHES